MLKFRINSFIDLRFEDGKTNIYVNNRLFNHCKYILLNLPADDSKNITDIDSIDDAVKNLNNSVEIIGNEINKINPEILFWAHCSNLQTWYENNYNTNLIHSNLAFPLLKELTRAGDLKATKIFKEEVAKRFEGHNLNVIQFLLYNKYLDCLNKEELETLLERISASLTDLVTRKLREQLKAIYANFREIKDVIDILLFLDLNYNQNLILRILNKLSMKNNTHFTYFLILHLNFKDHFDFKIPYGKFFTYFEKILNDIYKNYPEIDDLLKIIDSGFINGGISLDEKLSYGFVSNPEGIYEE